MATTMHSFNLISKLSFAYSMHLHYLSQIICTYSGVHIRAQLN